MSLSRVVRPDAGWVLSLYPTAGEAGGSFVPSYRPKRAWVPAGSAADPARARVEAARRAKKRVRVYCAANRLTRLGTLTYAGAGCHDPAQLRADVADFFRTLRDGLGRGPFPYVWVPEWHKTDHGLHVHLAVGQFIPRGQLATAWGRGFVHIKSLSDQGVGSTMWQSARLAAGYLSKYVSKAFEADPDDDSGSGDSPGEVAHPERERVLGLHRYEVAQGFQPPVVRLAGRSSSEALGKAVTVMGGQPTHAWSSDEAEGWKAPPAVWFAWA